MSDFRTEKRPIAALGHALLVVLGAAALSAGCFMVLPVILAITQGGPPKKVISAVEAPMVEEPPTPPPIEEEEPEPEEPEEPPPELQEEEQLMTLDQLAAALDVGSGGTGFLGGDFARALTDFSQQDGDGASATAFGGIDSEPRPIYRANPNLDSRARAKTPGVVVVVAIVDESGRVQNARVEQSSASALENPVLAAFRRWKFEPARRGDQTVSRQVRQTIRIPKL